MLMFTCLPGCRILESSQPQLSKSPAVQFLVSVYITPAALMAWTKEVSLVAKINNKQRNPDYFTWISSLARLMRNWWVLVLCVKSTLRAGASRLLSKKAHDHTNFSCHRFDPKRVLPLRMPLCGDNESVFSGQFHFSKANCRLHSCIALCAPTRTLLA